MRIREFTPADESALAELLITIWAPYYEETFPAMMGTDDELAIHQHGNWREDQLELARTLHNPSAGRHLALAVNDDDVLAGVVGWHLGKRPHSGGIDPLGVSPLTRNQGLGRALMDHAIAALREQCVRYLEIGTGGDDYHASARKLYESYGMHPIPVTVFLGRI